MSSPFQVGDQVRINLPGDPYHGREGTILEPTTFENKAIFGRRFNVLVGPFNVRKYKLENLIKVRQAPTSSTYIPTTPTTTSRQKQVVTVIPRTAPTPTTTTIIPYKVGDRVQINLPGDEYHGREGTILEPTTFENKAIFGRRFNVLVGPFNVRKYKLENLIKVSQAPASSTYIPTAPTTIASGAYIPPTTTTPSRQKQVVTVIPRTAPRPASTTTSTYVPPTTPSAYFPQSTIASGAYIPPTTTTVPYTPPIEQILFVTHGEATTSRFQLPNNIEVVHFETSDDSISFITADIIIEKLRSTVASRRFGNNYEYSLLQGKWIDGFGNPHPQLKDEDGRFRVTTYLPNSNVENLRLTLDDPNLHVKSLIGFYDPSQAYLDFESILGGFTPPNPPTTGKDDALTNDFITELSRINEYPNTTLQTLVTFLSNRYHQTNPGQVVRLILICCRKGIDVTRMNQIMEPRRNQPLQGGKRRRAKKGRKQTRRRRGSRRRGRSYRSRR